MSWRYVERPSFIRCCEDRSISSEVRESIKFWAPTVNRTPTPRLKIIYRTRDNRYEAWSARIPNPDSNKGTSGGYRLIYFLDVQEGTTNMVYIAERDEWGFKDESPKKKAEYTHLVQEIKELLDSLEP